MLSRLRLSALAVLCCCLAACTTRPLPAAAAAPPATPPVASWQVIVTQSGGFAGIAQRFTAGSSNATLEVFNVVRGTTVLVPLSSAETQELAQSVMQLAGGPDIDLRSSSCRDCYVYEMTLAPGPGGKPRRVRYDSTAATATPEAGLAERVIAIGRAGIAKQTP